MENENQPASNEAGPPENGATENKAAIREEQQAAVRIKEDDASKPPRADSAQ